MSDRRVFRWATTSARLLIGTAVSIVAVVAVVTAVSVPWPTLVREPLSVPATPAPAESVIACDGALLSTRTQASPQDEELATLAADLVTPSSEDVVAELADRGIGFILLAPTTPPESDAARTMRLSAMTALGQRDTLVVVGDTAKGELWRVVDEIAPRGAEAASVSALAGWIAFGQFAVLGIALLLALPTATSIREARRTPRVVGPHWQEGR